jgi:hypothetical protein
MNLQKIISTTYEKVITVFDTLHQKVERYNQINQREEHGMKITGLITTFALILPLSAFTYWRLLLEEFHVDYFEFCYSFDDVYYILYRKGTLLWFTMLIMVFAIAACVISVRFWKYHLPFGIISFTCLVIGVIGSIGHFMWYQIILYIVMAFVIVVLYLFVNKYAMYGLALLAGLFLVTSAGADARQIKFVALKKDIKLKDGTFFLQKTDKNKYYVVSTSKYILIYDLVKDELLKKERELID